MPSPTDAHFEALQRRGHVPALRNRTAVIRFDIDGGADHWTVTIDRGDIAASPTSNATPDCVITSDRQLLDDVLSGRTNAMAAMLRGALITDGDVALLMATRRLIASTDGSAS